MLPREVLTGLVRELTSLSADFLSHLRLGSPNDSGD